MKAIIKGTLHQLWIQLLLGLGNGSQSATLAQVVPSSPQTPCQASR